MVDRDRDLLSEWVKTCGEEMVQQLVVRWSDQAGIHFLAHQPKVPRELRDKLSQAGFGDTIDKLIVAIAMSTTDRVIVTEDPDFWDPNVTQSKGDRKAPVAAILRESAFITALTLKDFEASLPT